MTATSAPANTAESAQHPAIASLDLSAVDLRVSGMTCAACAARIEKKLNRLDGVEASVNYATEGASVRYDASRVDPNELITAVEGIGYGARLVESAADRSEAEADAEREREAVHDRLTGLVRRLVVSAVLGLPVIAVSMISGLQFDGWPWVALALTTPVALWGAWPFHRAAVMNARHGATTMDTLVSLGVIAAYGWSVFALVVGDAGRSTMRMGFHVGAGKSDEIYFEVACAVIVFLLAGRTFEARAKWNAGEALRALIDLGARDVRVIDGSGEMSTMPVEHLLPGMRFVVLPGEKVATDGVVESGQSAIDASLFTGESVPVEVSPGSAVAGATINAGGRLVVRATRVGSDTALAHMARLVRDAQNGKASVQRLADRVSAVFVPTVIALAVLTFFGWVAFGHPVRAAFTAAVAVLIVACPCALGLATPTALLVGTGRGAQLGLLIRGPEILESTRRIDAIVLDKTGTITTGRMTVTSVAPERGVTRDQVLRDAAAVEAASEHPIGRAIVAAATAGGAPPLPSVTDFAAHAGAGVTGTVEGRNVAVARYSDRTRRSDESHRETLPTSAPQDAPSPNAGAAAVEARTVVGVTVDGTFIGAIALADTPKPTSREAIAAMRSSGLHTVLLSGDNHEVSRAIGNAVGVDEVIAEATPADKVATIRRLQENGRVVAMVGDGVNDAAALAAADVGIAIGGGTDAAMAAADLTVTSGDLRDVLTALGLARRTLRTIKTNLFWAFAYNVAALPLAITGRLNPAIAGAAMAGSSVLVVSNSLRLRRFKG